MTFKAACIQLTSSDNVDDNIAKLRTWVEAAAQQGASFVATPENTFYMRREGGDMPHYTLENHPGVKEASQLARQYQLWLLIGSVAITGEESGKTYNRSLLFNQEGKIVASYDKIHLFDVEIGDGQTYRESARIIPGGKAVMVATPYAKLGMTICYDVRFPQLYRKLASAGAEILAVPAAFTQKTGEAHWHILLRSRAIENGAYVIAPAQTGTHPGGRKTFGHSLIVDPWGEVLADAGTEEGIIVAEIDLEKVKRTRASLPSLAHDRDFSM
jgi:deaminated glutathione amidase